MINLHIKHFLIFFIIFYFFQANADEKLIAGTVSCSVQWSERCEEKKIFSVPENYLLCHHTIVIAEKAGDASHQVVASDQSSITVYFQAKGNQDRFKPTGASIKLNIELFGVKKTESCKENVLAPIKNPEVPALAPANDTKIVDTAPAPVPAKPTDDLANTHACACSQWLNWMKVERCLAQEKRADRPPCDSYEVTIQCVSSKEECRAMQKDNCPQIVGLNQSTSLKRLFIENSPYCQP